MSSELSMLSLPVVSAWVLTFAVHSTALVSAAWLVTKGLPRWSDANRELLWRSALYGALVTASLQVALVTEPAGGHLGLFAVEAGASPARAGEAALALVPGAFGELPRETFAPDAAARESFIARSWLALVALTAAALGVAATSVRRWHLRRMLRGRRPVECGPLSVQLAGLCCAAGRPKSVRLSTSDRLTSPIAFGVLRPEICIPERALRELPPRQAEGMLAHELAHLIRRDPLWLRLGEWVQCAFPWQPLFRVARRRLTALAEFRCDAIAADLAGHLPVAQCLVQVAGWVREENRPLLAGLHGMATTGCPLRVRVERLLAAERPRRSSRAWLLPALAAALAATTVSLPGASWRAWSRVESATENAELARQPLHDLLAVFDREHDALMREVRALRTEMRGVELDDQLKSLIQNLDVRLAGLERRRAGLEDLIRKIAAVESAAPGPVTSDQPSDE